MLLCYGWSLCHQLTGQFASSMRETLLITSNRYPAYIPRFIPSEPHSPWDGAVYVQHGSPLLSKSNLQTPPQTCPRNIHWVTLDPIKLMANINHYRWVLSDPGPTPSLASELEKRCGSHTFLAFRSEPHCPDLLSHDLRLATLHVQLEHNACEGEQ